MFFFFSTDYAKHALQHLLKSYTEQNNIIPHKLPMMMKQMTHLNTRGGTTGSLGVTICRSREPYVDIADFSSLLRPAVCFRVRFIVISITFPLAIPAVGCKTLDLHDLSLHHYSCFTAVYLAGLTEVLLLVSVQARLPT